MQLEAPYSDGTTHVVLGFDELLQRLCALVPRPGTHRVHHHGVLTPAARHRSVVVPPPKPDPDEPCVVDESGQLGPEPAVLAELGSRFELVRREEARTVASLEGSALQDLALATLALRGPS